MPYLRLKSKRDRDSLDEILHVNLSGMGGRYSVINDDNLGIIYFLTKDLYKLVSKEGSIKFDPIPRKKVSSSYVSIMRELYPLLGY